MTYSTCEPVHLDIQEIIVKNLKRVQIYGAIFSQTNMHLGEETVGERVHMVYSIFFI